MSKYAIGDEIILKCLKRMKEECNPDFELESICGIRAKIIEIDFDGYYRCNYDSVSITIDESMILGKIGNIVIQPGLGIAC